VLSNSRTFVCEIGSLFIPGIDSTTFDLATVKITLITFGESLCSVRKSYNDARTLEEYSEFVQLFRYKWEFNHTLDALKSLSECIRKKCPCVSSFASVGSFLKKITTFFQLFHSCFHCMTRFIHCKKPISLAVSWKCDPFLWPNLLV